MGTKYKAEQYDKIYIEVDKYWKHYSESPYLPIYEVAIKHLKTLNVLELGCGTGQFAEMLFDKFKNINYYGVDFSEQAIKMAKMFAPEFTFEVMDIEKPHVFDKIYYDTVILLEVLEHISDIKVLNNIKKGSHIIASVPNYDSENHLRFFKTIEEVEKRYYNHIKFDTIKWAKCNEDVRNWIVFSGTIK